MANNNNNIRNLLDKYTLTGSNYIDWRRNVQLVLEFENIQHTLTTEPPAAPGPNATQAQRNAYHNNMAPLRNARCILLGSMSSDLQKQCEAMQAPQIWIHVRNLYEGQVMNEQYDVSSSLYSCRMKESETIEAHRVRMIGYLTRLSDLGQELPRANAINLILNSLPPNYYAFVVNYNLHNFQDQPTELFNKVKQAEK